MTSDWNAYDDLCCYTLQHPGAAYIHQHVVDAYAAQRADESTKPVGLTFALVGLYLHVERHYSGREVQRIHMQMGREKRKWPVFRLPDQRGRIGPEEVMSEPEGPERDAAIDAWCASVWQAYGDQRAMVVQLLRECGIEPERPSVPNGSH